MAKIKSGGCSAYRVVYHDMPATRYHKDTCRWSKLGWHKNNSHDKLLKMAQGWRDKHFSDVDWRELVWLSGSPTVQAPFVQAITKHLGRNIWDIEKFKSDVRIYLLTERKWPMDLVDRYMKDYDEDMRDFMFQGWPMAAIGTAMQMGY